MKCLIKIANACVRNPIWTHLRIIMREVTSKFSKVVDVMHQGIKNSTKDVEKALKNASTPEEKLNAFLSM